MKKTSRRSTQDVLEDHLRLRLQGVAKIEEDIARNYADDVVLLTGCGVFRGHEGVRRSAQILHKHLPCSRYRYRTTLIDGEVAFLEWTARCKSTHVEDGADTFLIRDGRIVVQTIHYTCRKLPKPERRQHCTSSAVRRKQRKTLTAGGNDI